MLTHGAQPNGSASVTFTLGDLTIQWPISHINQALPWLQALKA